MEGLIVFAHGARDPRWAEPFALIVERVRARQPALDVRLAFLELMTPSLRDVVSELVQSGCSKIAIVPAFLGQGGHVRQDLPKLVDEVKASYPHVTFELARAVGESDAVIDAIAATCIEAAR